MKFSNKTKFVLLVLLIVLNVIMRIRYPLREIGTDSFLMHIMVNSLSEYGYAKWFLDPLSIVGIYPASYTSSSHFLLSGIFQLTNLQMESIVVLYPMFIGILSIFTAYLLADSIFKDDLYSILVAFGMSSSPATIAYTTLTLPTRGLLIVLAPLLIYNLLNTRISIKHIFLTIFMAAFLFSTHHLFYFLIPVFVSFIIIFFYFKLEKIINSHVPANIPKSIPIIIYFTGFFVMFCIPFFTGRFIEMSRYSPLHISYIRYSGILIVFAIGGLVYSIFKSNKNFNELVILLTVIFLTALIYEQTYMKWFLPIFIISFACIGIINIINSCGDKLPYLVSLIIILCVLFSGYYQFLHTSKSGLEPNIKISTYESGRWMKEYVNGAGISNDQIFGMRTAAFSETTHLLLPSTITNQIYGFNEIDITQYKRYPLTSEDFWFSGYDGRDVGEPLWYDVNTMRTDTKSLNITHVIENKRAGGNILWNHGIEVSKIVRFANINKNYVYNNGDCAIWYLL